jgi:uncharacterized protein YdhG (YjbR/CyaY superfamily)
VKTATKPASVDEYIGAFPKDVQKKLKQLRSLIRKTAPGADERLSYGMPAFFLNGILVWYAAYAKHIGLYPKAAAIQRFEGNLSKFKHAKGSVQFPLDKPLPVQIITKIVKFRIAENARRSPKTT